MERYTSTPCQQAVPSIVDDGTSSGSCISPSGFATQLRRQRPVVVTRVALDLCQRAIDNAQVRLRQALASYLTAAEPAAQEAALVQAEQAVQIAARRFVLAKRLSQYAAVDNAKQDNVEPLLGKAHHGSSDPDEDDDEVCSSFRSPETP